MSNKRLEFIRGPLNLSNDTTDGAFTDPISGQKVPGGGLILGDYIELTDAEALTVCDIPTGILFGGRYRRIKLDAGATVANVLKGNAAFVVPGSSVFNVVATVVGVALTPGTYLVNATGGGGTGAQISVVVGAGGTVTSTTLVNGGKNYTTTPTFTLAAGGTTNATFVVFMVINDYIVTTSNIVGVNLSQGRGVFLNVITPGNYGWIQENGIATFNVSTAAGAIGALVTAVQASSTFITAVAGPASPTFFGTASDTPVVGLVRGLLDLAVWPS